MDSTARPLEASLLGLMHRGGVSRRVYADPALFDLEMRRLFGRIWVFVGHESEVRAPGDFVRSRVGIREVIVTRAQDGGIHVLRNRCPHRGAQLCATHSGNSRLLRCPYHAWAFEMDGRLRAVPNRPGYGADFDISAPEYQVSRAPRVDTYRGFIFASFAEDGPSLLEQLGGITSTIDGLVDRAPGGELELTGSTLRQEMRGNWKLYVENALDLVHVGIAHESCVAAASDLDDQELMSEQAFQMYRANGLSLAEWDRVGLIALDGGHGYMEGYYPKEGILAAMRADPIFSRYHDDLVAWHGREKAEQVLTTDRFNNIIFPNIGINFRFQQIRIIQPLTVDRTVIITRSFRMPKAPPEFFKMALTFQRTVNSPASLIAADDFDIFERCQRGLGDPEVDWVDFSRGRGREHSFGADSCRTEGTNEQYSRAFFRAWGRHMGIPGAESV